MGLAPGGASLAARLATQAGEGARAHVTEVGEQPHDALFAVLESGDGESEHGASCPHV